VARIVGVELPDNKRILFALPRIYGIGRSTAEQICDALGIDPMQKLGELSSDQLNALQDYITEHYKVEGDLRREVAMNIKRLVDIKCYRGIRHQRGLPVRGQRTRHNARTRKGPRKTVGAKKGRR
jgi:small subunit ribosomal protein S13